MEKKYLQEKIADLEEIRAGASAGATSVQYENQTLTDSQKAQARQNINAAAPDGYYGESGGVFQFATNFKTGNVVDAQNRWQRRPTASIRSGGTWGINSIDGDNAEIQTIRGNTIYYKQICTSRDITVDHTNYVWAPTKSGVVLPKGHVVMVLSDIDTTYSGSSYCVVHFTKPGSTAELQQVRMSYKARSYAITTLRDDVDRLRLYATSSGSTLTETTHYKNFQVFDLTAMFGAGKEPTAEQFMDMFPATYYPSSGGEYIHNTAASIFTNGFNQLDTTGNIAVFGGLTYRIEGSYTSIKDRYGNDVTVTNNEFVPVEDDNYTVVGTPCIHLKWGGNRDGEKEAYWEGEHPLPIATYFPDGMKKAGSVYDELTKDKAIQRVVAVDLGTLTYSQWYNGFQSNVAGEIKGVTIDETPNVFCFRYTTRTPNQAADTGKQYSQGISAPTNGFGNATVVIRDSSYTTAEELKASLQGVYAFFERKTPVETPISPMLNFNYRVDDFGTERIDSTNPVGIVFDADIRYSFDYEAQVRNNNELNITKESLDDLISAINATGLMTITQRWNKGSRKYEYSVTLNTINDSWVFTLEDGTTVTKEPLVWNSTSQE